MSESEILYLSSRPAPGPSPARTPDFWDSFNARFPTEAAAVDELFERINAISAVTCPDCRSQRISRKDGRRNCRCDVCGSHFSFTAATFFRGIRKVRLWLAGIMAIEAGLITNAYQFRSMIRCAYASALIMFRKLRIVLVCKRTEDLHDQAKSAVFAAIIFKRSQCTRKFKHPRTEELDCASAKDGTKKDSENSGEHTADDFVIIKDFIGEVFKGISRKYLQLYVCAFWCCVEKTLFKERCLLADCLRSYPITYQQTLNYITPAIVALPAGMRSR